MMVMARTTRRTLATSSPTTPQPNDGQNFSWTRSLTRFTERGNRPATTSATIGRNSSCHQPTMIPTGRATAAAAAPRSRPPFRPKPATRTVLPWIVAPGSVIRRPPTTTMLES